MFQLGAISKFRGNSKKNILRPGLPGSKKLKGRIGPYMYVVQKRSGVNFTNVLRTAFAPVDPNSVKSSVSFYAFGIYERKSCT